MWNLGHERAGVVEKEADRIIERNRKISRLEAERIERDLLKKQAEFESRKCGRKQADEYSILSDRQYRRRREREEFIGEDIERLPFVGQGVDPDFWERAVGSMRA